MASEYRSVMFYLGEPLIWPYIHMASNQNMTVDQISSMIVNAVLTRAIQVVILAGYSCLILVHCDRYMSSHQLGDETGLNNWWTFLVIKHLYDLWLSILVDGWNLIGDWTKWGFNNLLISGLIIVDLLKTSCSDATVPGREPKESCIPIVGISPTIRCYDSNCYSNSQYPGVGYILTKSLLLVTGQLKKSVNSE